MIGLPLFSIHDDDILEGYFDSIREKSTREQGVLERSSGSKCALTKVTTHCMYGYWNG